jgi:hydrogenase maturation protein HypF
VTTSAGRLFDGVAALLGLRQRASFEGQAASEIEFAASRAPAAVEEPPMPVVDGVGASGRVIDWRPWCAALLRERAGGDVAMLAARFHGALAASIVEVARRVGLRSVVLTGGCFQNARLLEATAGALRAADFAVLQHRQLPPNDGGLAAGQALAALWGVTQVATGAAPVQ